jgi:hypothetical protein
VGVRVGGASIAGGGIDRHRWGLRWGRGTAGGCGDLCVGGAAAGAGHRWGLRAVIDAWGLRLRCRLQAGSGSSTLVPAHPTGSRGGVQGLGVGGCGTAAALDFISICSAT